MTQIPSVTLQRAIDRLGRAYAGIGAGPTYSRSEIASALGYTNPQSGRFSALITGYQLYGLIERTASHYTFSQNFVAIYTSANNSAGRTAFVGASLNPQVFRVMFDSFKGLRLPPDLARWLVHRFHGDLSEQNAADAVRIFKENASSAGLLKDEILLDLAAVSDSSATQDVPRTPQVRAVLGDPQMQADSTDLKTASAHATSTIQKDFGNGRMARVSIPADITQEERDNLMALIQYL